MVVTNDDLDVVSNDLIGRMCGGFRVEKVLGEGGMGMVLLAVNPLANNKRAAVKVLLPEYQKKREAVSRFHLECFAAAAITDVHAVQVLDVNTWEDGRSYLLMEFVPDGSLDKLCQQRGQLSLELTLSIASQMAATLDAAYKLGITHRDIKPENVMLEIKPDGYIFVKVADWGLAKLKETLIKADKRDHKTATKKIFGSPGFMSPEQCQGKSSSADHRTDVYALASTIYLMVCGQRPYPDDNVLTLITDVALGVQFAPARSLRPDLPLEFEAAIHAGLAHNPKDRIQTAKELVQRLSHALVGGGEILSFSGGSGIADGKRPPSASTISDGMGSALTQLVELQAAAATATAAAMAATAAAAAARLRLRRLVALLAVAGFVVGLATGLIVMLARATHAKAPLAVVPLPDAAAGSAVASGNVPANAAPDDAALAIAPADALALARDAVVLNLPASANANTPKDAGPVDAVFVPSARDAAVPVPVTTPRLLVDAGALSAPLPAVRVVTGELDVGADPYAEVYLMDGGNKRHLGQTPLTTRVPVGSHRVLLENPDHKLSKTVNVTVTASSRAVIDDPW